MTVLEPRENGFDWRRDNRGGFSTATSAMTESSNESAVGQKEGRKRQKYSFKGELYQLWGNITTHCYRNLVQEDRSIWER